MGNEPFLLDAETDGDGILSYESRNPEIVTVDETGTVTLLAAGTAQIVITASETDSYKTARKTITVAVIPEGYTPIHDIADLYAIRNNRSGNYILMNDIDMSSTAQGGDYDCGTGWDSIEEFRGTLDGNGYRIVGMQIFGEPAADTKVVPDTSAASACSIPADSPTVPAARQNANSIANFLFICNSS